jgi:uridine kinase
MPKTNPILIAIVGGSGAGKSFLAEKLTAALAPNAARISLDDFYLDRSHLPPGRRAKLNFDHPRAIDWIAFARVLKNLRDGRDARVPVYEFATHSRTTRERRVKPKRYMIVEGLWLLHRPALRRLFDFTIFLDCSPSLRRRRRLARDLKSRSRTRESIIAQLRSTVEPMHCLYVAPQARWASRVFKTSCGKKELKTLVLSIRKLASFWQS